MKLLITGLLISAFLTGCAAPKNWAATGGSRADGTIKLSYEFGMFENPQVSEEQGTQLAAARCSSWGYKNAEPFGGATKTCTMMSSSGCSTWLVTKEYQCLGSLEK